MYEDAPDDFEAVLAAHFEAKAVPRGSLGRLERLASQVARVQRRLDPVMSRAGMVLFAADHGIAAEGVSAFPTDLTRRMVLDFIEGRAAINIFARQSDLDVRVVNAGVRGGAFHAPKVEDLPLGEGSANFLHQPAISSDLLYRAIRTGRRIGAEGDHHALAFGEIGVGNSSSATMIAHRLTGAPLRGLVGRGSGLDSAGLLHKAEVLEAANARVPGSIGPERALGEYGGFEIAMMTGAMLGAAAAGRIILVDGFTASVAALAACQLEPDARASMIYCHRSREPGHAAVLDAMGARPLFDLDLSLGQGTGAALAWPLLRASVAVLNEMASFDKAG
jgi:nicotinate-nucleotide--dimethylbenzimidazole phosphoribosyltransferase